MGTIAIFSLIASLLIGAASIATQKNANEANVELSRENREDEQEFAHKEAEIAREANITQYNQIYSPAAKVQQYEDAGLSPGLMYSNGVAQGIGGTAQMASTGSHMAPYVNPVINDMLLEIASKAMKTGSDIDVNTQGIKESSQRVDESKKRMDEIDSEIRLNNQKVEEIMQNIKTSISEENYNNIRTMLAGIESEIMQVEKEIAVATKQNKIDMIQHSLFKLLKENRKLDQEIDILKIEKKWADELKQATVNNIAASTAKMWAEEGEAYTRSWLNVVDEYLHSSEIEKNSAYIEWLTKDKEKMDALIREVDAQIILWTKEGELIDKEKVTEVFKWLGEISDIMDAHQKRMMNGAKFASKALLKE